MDIKNLTTFVHVAELSSFSKAGERLGYSQPTVSVQIRQLEDEFGFKLFDRIGHAVRLTDKGREILFHAQKVCHLCEEIATSSTDDGPKQTLIRLATSDSLCESILHEDYSLMRKLHPNIIMNLSTAGTGDLFKLLDHNEVDLVCTLDSHIYNTNYVIASEEKIGVHIVVSSGSLLAKKTILTKDDLINQDFILTEKGMSYRRFLDEWFAKDSIEITPVLETARADLICSLVEVNLGIAFLPDFATEKAYKAGTIVRKDIEGFEPDLWKQLLYHRDKWISPAMQTVIDILSRDK